MERSPGTLTKTRAVGSLLPKGHTALREGGPCYPQGQPAEKEATAAQDIAERWTQHLMAAFEFQMEPYLDLMASQLHGY